MKFSFILFGSRVEKFKECQDGDTLKMKVKLEKRKENWGIELKKMAVKMERAFSFFIENWTQNQKRKLPNFNSIHHVPNITKNPINAVCSTAH